MGLCACRHESRTAFVHLSMYLRVRVCVRDCSHARACEYEYAKSGQFFFLMMDNRMSI